MIFEAHQFKSGSIEQTGVIETYDADDIVDAVQKLQYARGLEGIKTEVGPTGRCIYAGKYCWSIIKAKECNHV